MLLVISLRDGNNEMYEIPLEEFEKIKRTTARCPGERRLWMGEQFMYLELWVALSDQIDYNHEMDKLKELIKTMEDDMRADLERSGDLEEYGEEGIRIAVYEDLKDSLKYEFSDILNKWVARSPQKHYNNIMNDENIWEQLETHMHENLGIYGLKMMDAFLELKEQAEDCGMCPPDTPERQERFEQMHG